VGWRSLADNIDGNGAGNRLVGTEGKDTISGGGADSIFGRGGPDRLFGDSGNDNVHGRDGADRLQVGLGRDEVFGQGATTSSTPSTCKPTTASITGRATI
jgi:Ca2+-binding RTX toxin-like protein